MVRNSRLVTRLFFLAVFVMALFGGIYAMTAWRVDAASLPLEELSNSQDWVDFASTFSEELLQLFLGLTASH